MAPMVMITLLRVGSVMQTVVGEVVAARTWIYGRWEKVGIQERPADRPPDLKGTRVAADKPFR